MHVSLRVHSESGVNAAQDARAHFALSLSLSRTHPAAEAPLRTSVAKLDMLFQHVLIGLDSLLAQLVSGACN